MSHAYHRFWKCYKTFTFCSLLKRCTIPCACHAKRHLNLQKWSEPLVFSTFWLRNVPRTTTACTFLTSQLPKVVRGWSVLYILTSKCASRHNGVHFFDISTSKSGPTQVFCTFSLGNVLRATTACNFLSLIWPPGSAPAASASLLFDPPEPQIIAETLFRDFPTFSRICICFLLTLSLLWSSLFYSPLLSASAQLCFSSVHIVGSLTSKLPLIILHVYGDMHAHTHTHTYLHLCIYTYVRMRIQRAIQPGRQPADRATYKIDLQEYLHIYTQLHVCISTCSLYIYKYTP